MKKFGAYFVLTANAVVLELKQPAWACSAARAAAVAVKGTRHDMMHSRAHKLVCPRQPIRPGFKTPYWHGGAKLRF